MSEIERAASEGLPIVKGRECRIRQMTDGGWGVWSCDAQQQYLAVGGEWYALHPDAPPIPSFPSKKAAEAFLLSLVATAAKITGAGVEAPASLNTPKL